MTPLIIKKNNKDVFFNKIDKVEIESYYNCKVTNILFKAFRKLKIPFMQFFFGEWKKKLDNYDTIIFFDNGFSSLVSKYIKRKNKKIRLILWFWNPVKEESEKFLKDKNIDEIWTYDKKDAKNYNLKYNTQFYYTEKDDNKYETKQDIIFLGTNKGRKKYIEELKEECKDYNIKLQAFIIESPKDYVPYEQYIKYVKESRAILELIVGDIKGLTLRTMEALFLKKKLITNNKDLKNYEFYNSNNIYILENEEKDIKKLKEFMDKPYIEIDKDIIEYYDFNHWIKRFEVN